MRCVVTCGWERQDELVGQLAAAAGTVHLATARLVEVLATVFAEGAWECPGIRSREHFVMWQVGVSRHRAEGLVALATRRAELPATSGRFDAGELSEDHATAIARRCPASHDARTVEQAPKLTHPQLVRALRLLPPLPDAAPDPADPPPPPVPPRREVAFAYLDSGCLSGRFVLPADEGAIVEAALRRHRQELFDDAGNDDGHASWADALVRLATTALDTDTTSAAERDRYIVDIHLVPTGTPRPGSTSARCSTPPPGRCSPVTRRSGRSSANTGRSSPRGGAVGSWTRSCGA